MVPKRITIRAIVADRLAACRGSPAQPESRHCVADSTERQGAAAVRARRAAWHIACVESLS
jgi:hypothetical protein